MRLSLPPLSLACADALRHRINATAAEKLRASGYNSKDSPARIPSCSRSRSRLTLDLDLEGGLL